MEHKEAYIFKPLPDCEKLYGVTGPGTEHLEGETFTKEGAEAIVDIINKRLAGAA